MGPGRKEEPEKALPCLLLKPLTWTSAHVPSFPYLEVRRGYCCPWVDPQARTGIVASDWKLCRRRFSVVVEAQ